jgi:hypothetical protein
MNGGSTGRLPIGRRFPTCPTEQRELSANSFQQSAENRFCGDRAGEPNKVADASGSVSVLSQSSRAAKILWSSSTWQTTKCDRLPHPDERGSALIIVFVFAAMIAIMLYRELPVAAFEAQRQREQVLIDRGNEYAHAVKLYVRKVGGNYPASMDQLENTNRMRFLRHRFKDPITGKDDWRLLHAGPGGMLLDSKVNPVSNAQNAGGNNSSSSFNGSTSNPNSTTPEAVVPSVPQRPPAIAANSGGEAAGPASTDPMAPFLPASQTGTTAPPTPQANSPDAHNAQPGAPPVAAAPPSNAGPNSASPMESVRSLLNNPNPSGSTQQSSAPPQSTMGRIATGGIAGVASKAGGHSIKTVNDQTDYSLWEFYYDPSKDTMRGLPGGAMPGAVTPGGGRQPGQAPGFGPTPGGQPTTFGGPPPMSNSPSPTPLTTATSPR